MMSCFQNIFFDLSFFSFGASQLLNKNLFFSRLQCIKKKKKLRSMITYNDSLGILPPKQNN